MSTRPPVPSAIVHGQPPGAGAAAVYAWLLTLHARPGGPPVFTPAGEAVVRRLAEGGAPVPRPGPTNPLVPHWDGDARRLWFGGAVIKAFRQPAPYQTALLATFEECGWAARIDDPLPPEPGDDAEAVRQRLHDAIKHLSRGLEAGTIDFHGDGTGRGVRWAPCPVAGG